MAKNKPYSSITQGYFFALLSAVVLSLTAIFIRHLSVEYNLPSLILAVWRDFFVILTLFPVLLIFKRTLIKAPRKQLKFLVAYGLILAVFNASWTLSVAYTGAAVATVLCYISGAFTVLLGWLLLKEKLSWTKIIVVIISLTGCLFVSGALDVDPSKINWFGIAAGIVAGLCYAAYSLMGREASNRGLNPWTTLLYTFSFAAVSLLMVNLIFGSILPETINTISDFLWLGDSWQGWLVLFLLGAGPTVLGFGTYNIALTHLDSSIVNLIVTLEPAFTMTIAYFLLGERFTAMQLAGSLLIMMGVAILRIFEKPTGNSGTEDLIISPTD